MHVDENKKFDKRNIEKNIKDGIITQKEYEAYLNRLPDASEKIFSLGEDEYEPEGFEPFEENGTFSKNKGLKRKASRG